MTQTYRKTFLVGAIAALLAIPMIAAGEVTRDGAQAPDVPQAGQQWRGEATTGYRDTQPHDLQDRPGPGQPGIPAQPGEDREYLNSLEQDQLLVDDLIGQPVRSRQGMGRAEPTMPRGADQPMQRGEQPWPSTRLGAGTSADEGQKVGAVEDVILDQQGQVVGLVISRDAADDDASGGQVALSWRSIDLQRDPEDRESWIVYADVDKEGVDQAREFNKDGKDARFRATR